MSAVAPDVDLYHHCHLAGFARKGGLFALGAAAPAQVVSHCWLTRARADAKSHGLELSAPSLFVIPMREGIRRQGYIC